MRIYNDNPQGKRVDDCTVRAIAVATGESWEYTYIMLCIQGFLMADMPHSNAVWAAYLRSRGWKRSVIPNSSKFGIKKTARTTARTGKRKP